MNTKMLEQLPNRLWFGDYRYFFHLCPTDCCEATEELAGAKHHGAGAIGKGSLQRQLDVSPLGKTQMFLAHRRPSNIADELFKFSSSGRFNAPGAIEGEAIGAGALGVSKHHRLPLPPVTFAEFADIAQWPSADLTIAETRSAQ